MTKEAVMQKYANITTYDGNKYKIRRKNCYIHGTNIQGYVDIIKSKNSKSSDLHILKEVYSLDNNRLRGLFVVLRNPIIFNTIEKDINLKEEKIIVVSNYDKIDECIMSIGNIKHFESDKINSSDKNTKLILKPYKKIKRIAL